MVKPREKRVPIMMSEDEMAAIDDWRFANRVATRSDAIRRLCQIGIAFEQGIDPIDEELRALPAILLDLLSEHVSDEEFSERLWPTFRKVLHALFETNKYMTDAAMKANLYRNGPDMEEIKAKVAEWDELAAEVYAKVDVIRSQE